MNASMKIVVYLAVIFCCLDLALQRHNVKLSLVTCDVPVIANALVTLMNTGEVAPVKVPAGTKIVITCNGGFELKQGANHSVCLRRGQWLHKFGTCPPYDFPKQEKCVIPLVENGDIQITAHDNNYILDSYVAAGTMIAIRCREGYMIQGYEVSMCLEGGQWSTDIGTCKQLKKTEQKPELTKATSYNEPEPEPTKEVSFQEPKPEPTKEVSFQEPKPEQTTETSFKEPKPELTTETSFKEPKPELTKEVHLPKPYVGPSEPSHSKSLGTSGNAYLGFRNSLTLKEIEGYPKCTFKRIACKLPTETNGKFYANGEAVTRDYVLPTTKVVLSCNAGYHVPSEMDYSYCLELGQWSNQFGSCQKTCPELPEVENGAFSISDDHSVGSERFLICYEGFDIKGPSNVICSVNGTWTEPGKCIKYCKELPNIPNGFVAAADDDTVGTTRQIGCNAGYMLFSDQKITCLPGGKWSTPKAPCMEIDVCGQRPKIEKGEYEENDESRIYHPGSVHKFRCNSGLDLFGPDSVTCEGPGLWTQPGHCLPGCGPLPVVRNGYVENRIFNLKTGLLKVECNTGFDLYGSGHVRCNSDKHEWSKVGSCLEACEAKHFWPRPGSLVAFWPFDERSELGDIGPHGFSLDFDTQNAVQATDVDGPFTGKCYTVRNDDQYIGFRGFLKEASSFTISFYFFTNGLENSPILMFYYNEPQFAISYIAPTFLEIRTGNGMQTGEIAAIFEDVFTADRWNFVAIVYDKGIEEISIYGRNGLIAGPVETSGPMISGWESLDWFYVGKAPNSTACCPGMKKSDALACLMIYDAPLADTEVVKLQRACRCQREKPTTVESDEPIGFF